MSGQSTLLEIRDLHVGIDGNEILKGIDLKIGPGEIHAIMGRNGSGKTTTANVIMGHPDFDVEKGDVVLEGESLLELEAWERARKGVFLSFQYPQAVPGLQVGNFLRKSVASIRGEDEAKGSVFRKELTSAMESLDIPRSFMSRYVNDGFSGGEKKRFEILQLMLLKPRLAVLDETDSGLDIDGIRTVSEGVNAAIRGTDSAALIITHYSRILEHVQPDMVHVLLDGRIVASGGPELATKLEERGYEWLNGGVINVSGDSEAREAVGEYKAGWHDPENSTIRFDFGLSEEVVRQISELKEEPEWMTDIRVKAFKHFSERPMPTWGNTSMLEEIDFENICYYLKSSDSTERDWEDVPDDIRNTFERLGIPEAEQKWLSGVTAQYESEAVYHSIREDLEKQGVIFLDMDSGLKEYPEIVKKWFCSVSPLF